MHVDAKKKIFVYKVNKVYFNVSKRWQIKIVPTSFKSLKEWDVLKSNNVGESIKCILVLNSKLSDRIGPICYITVTVLTVDLSLDQLNRQIHILGLYNLMDVLLAWSISL